MRQPLPQFLFMILAVGLGSCTPFGEESSSGVCSTDGTNTHQFAGAWKKIDGYPTNRTAAELENSFDLLMIERGDRLCEAEILNLVPQGANYRALFTVDVNKRVASVQYDEDNRLAPDAVPTEIRYSFSGSCDQTNLLLRYPNGSFEKYRIYGTNVAVGSCDPEQ